MAHYAVSRVVFKCFSQSTNANSKIKLSLYTLTYPKKLRFGFLIFCVLNATCQFIDLGQILRFSKKFNWVQFKHQKKLVAAFKASRTMNRTIWHFKSSLQPFARFLEVYSKAFYNLQNLIYGLNLVLGPELFPVWLIFGVSWLMQQK